MCGVVELAPCRHRWLQSTGVWGALITTNMPSAIIKMCSGMGNPLKELRGSDVLVWFSELSNGPGLQRSQTTTKS